MTRRKKEVRREVFSSLLVVASISEKVFVNAA
jgi:hypothetical protein